MTSTSQKTVPFLFQYASQRTGTDKLPGRYDTDRKVWVIEEDGKVAPFIEKAQDQANLVTKTMQQVESDDQNFGQMNEISTKTEAQRERDDQASCVYNSMLMLVTKTASQIERDD